MSKKLFVGGLPWSVNDEELKAAFTPFGTVIDAKVINDRETGRSRGFGFVSFTNDADAAKAIKEMDGFVMGSRTINVNEAQERAPRTGGGGGSGGGGGGYSDPSQRFPPGDGGGGGERRDGRRGDRGGRRGDRD